MTSSVTHAPYNAQQNKMCHHESDGWYYDADGVRHETEWRPWQNVTSTFLYDGYRKGQSAAYFWWVDTVTETRYPMFMTDMNDLLLGAHLQSMGGATYFVATITIAKRGQNYGVKLVP